MTQLMDNLGSAFRFFALKFFAKDWNIVKDALIRTYLQFSTENEYRASPLTQSVLVSAEDHRFFKHCGFDVIAACRAIWRCLFRGVVEGGSTIEQQLIRILSGKYERTFRRKIREILLASLITEVIPKKSIPGVYLHVAYFGWRMNGFKQACLRLNINPNKISLSEASALIARLKYPEPKWASDYRLKQIQIRRDHLRNIFYAHDRSGFHSSLFS